MKKADRIRSMLHREMFWFWFLGSLAVLMGSHIYGSRSLRARDVSAILRYDSLRRRRPGFVPLPNLYTENGRKVLKKLLKAYEDDRPLSDIEYQDKLLNAGGWRCTCGRVNPNYTATCVCGTHMRQIPPSDRCPAPQPVPAPKPTHWLCTCGRENPNYTSTCVCGKNKRDIKETP